MPARTHKGENYGGIWQAPDRCRSQRRNLTFRAKDYKTGQPWWICRTTVASGKRLTDISRDAEISPSVPRIIRLDSLGESTELR
jgi:hypothetical protein